MQVVLYLHCLKKSISAQYAQVTGHFLLQLQKAQVTRAKIREKLFLTMTFSLNGGNLPLFFKSQTQGILQYQQLIAFYWTEVWIMFFAPKSNHLLFSNPNRGNFGKCYQSCWSQNS